MIFDDLAEILKSCEPDIKIVKQHWAKNKFEDRFKELEEISQQENFWQHPNQIEISKELQQLRSNKETYDFVTNSYTDNLELIELLKEIGRAHV